MRITCPTCYLEDETMTQTYIELSAARYRQNVEVTQVAWNVDAPYDVWQSTDGVTHYDALSVAADVDDADDVEESLRDAGIVFSGRRPIYAVSGPQGDVLHEVYAD